MDSLPVAVRACLSQRFPKLGIPLQVGMGEGSFWLALLDFITFLPNLFMSSWSWVCSLISFISIYLVSKNPNLLRKSFSSSCLINPSAFVFHSLSAPIEIIRQKCILTAIQFLPEFLSKPASRYTVSDSGLLNHLLSFGADNNFTELL